MAEQDSSGQEELDGEGGAGWGRGGHWRDGGMSQLISSRTTARGPKMGFS